MAKTTMTNDKINRTVKYLLSIVLEWFLREIEDNNKKTKNEILVSVIQFSNKMLDLTLNLQ